MQKLFEFYSENESQIEFLTWYRQYDRPEGTCVTEAKIEGKDVSVGGDFSLGSDFTLGTSEFVIERLDFYICNAGLIDINGNEKSSWNEFKNQIQMNN